jgi:hypothetical protein
VQWEPVADGRYFLDWRERTTGGEWSSWNLYGREIVKPWINLALHREGSEVQARVRHMDGEWELATEVIFTRSKCVFELATHRRSARYAAGDDFTAIVDGAPCVYVLGEDIEAELGKSVRFEMEALEPTGWSQLDCEDHFHIWPSLGVVVRNVEPSRFDLEPTGRNFTELKPRKRLNPLRVGIRRRKSF